jgi:entericidin B
MKKAQTWMLRLCLILALVGPLAACNTIEGVGEDTEAAGDAISDTARDAKH